MSQDPSEDGVNLLSGEPDEVAVVAPVTARAAGAFGMIVAAPFAILGFGGALYAISNGGVGLADGGRPLFLLVVSGAHLVSGIAGIAAGNRLQQRVGVVQGGVVFAVTGLMVVELALWLVFEVDDGLSHPWRGSLQSILIGLAPFIAFWAFAVATFVASILAIPASAMATWHRSRE